MYPESEIITMNMIHMVTYLNKLNKKELKNNNNLDQEINFIMMLKEIKLT
jgi:hypothetical protein